jgi:phosphohistidine phosphatase SixA
VVLVGHEPDLSAFLATALAGGSTGLKAHFKNGGAACLRFERRVRPGSGTLVWMLPPRVLRALR